MLTPSKCDPNYKERKKDFEKNPAKWGANTVTILPESLKKETEPAKEPAKVENK